VPAPDHRTAARRSRLSIVVFPLVAADLARFADQQITRLAAEHLADDLQVIEPDGDRLPGPQVRTAKTSMPLR